MSSGNRPRIRDYGIIVGTLPPGEYNAITDVPGVQVGHLTLIKGDHGERWISNAPGHYKFIDCWFTAFYLAANQSSEPVLP